MVPHEVRIGETIEDQLGQELFAMSEVVAFCGLANREFFSHNYWGRDNFRLVIQNYAEPKAGTKFATRRRDGSTTVLVSETAHVVLPPEHLTASSRVTLDEDLLAILSARERPESWESVYEAILHFNLANTDSEAVSESMELVLLQAAYERLAGSSSGKCEPIIDLVEAALSDRLHVGPGDSSRLPEAVWKSRFGKRQSLATAWMHDFCALRGTVAHGASPEKYPSVWSPREHLLFGTLLFPVLAKRAVGLTDGLRERKIVRVFERLLDVEPFADLPDIDDPSKIPWNAVLDEVHFEVLFEEVDLEASDDEAQPGAGV